MIIGLGGKKGSGKTEIANYLSSKFDLQTYSFAASLKKLVTEVCGLTDSDKLSVKYFDGKIFNIEPIKREIKKYEYEKLTPEELDHIRALEYFKVGEIYRNLMQYIGTNIFRKRNEYHWINQFKSSVPESFIVDDIRFENEFRFISSLKDSKCVKIIRNSDNYDDHISELEIDKIKFRHKFINNTNNISDLYKSIDSYFII